MLICIQHLGAGIGCVCGCGGLAGLEAMPRLLGGAVGDVELQQRLSP